MERAVELFPERAGRTAVDDHGHFAGQLLIRCVVEPQVLEGQVAGNSLDLAAHPGVEVALPLAPETIEYRRTDDLPIDPLDGVHRATRSYEQIDLFDGRQIAQDLLENRLPQHAGSARQEDALPGVPFLQRHESLGFRRHRL